MTWLGQHSLGLADAGFDVLLIGVALVLMQPVEANKRPTRALRFLVIGAIGLLAGYVLGMKVLTKTGAALIAAAILDLVQWRIDSGKGTKRDVKWGVCVVCVIGSVLVLLSVIGSIWT